MIKRLRKRVRTHHTFFPSSISSLASSCSLLLKKSFHTSCFCVSSSRFLVWRVRVKAAVHRRYDADADAEVSASQSETPASRAGSTATKTRCVSFFSFVPLLQHHCRVEVERSVLPRRDTRHPDSQSDHGLTGQQVSRSETVGER